MSTPTRAAGRRRRTAATRRAGHVATVVVDLLCLAAVNWWPGWEVVPFVTSEADRVVDLVNASIVLHLGLFALYLLWDPRWLRALGEIATSAFGVVVGARVWDVYPFDTADDWSGWGLAAHLLLGLGIAGSAIGAVAGLAHLSSACRPDPGPG